MRKGNIMVTILLLSVMMAGCGREKKSEDVVTEILAAGESSAGELLSEEAPETMSGEETASLESEMAQPVDEELQEEDMIPAGAEGVDTFHVRKGLSFDLMNGEEIGQYDIRVTYDFDYGTKDGVLLVWWENLNVEPVEFVPFKPAPDGATALEGCYLIEELSSPGTYVFDVGETIPGTFLIIGSTNEAMEGVSVTLMEREELKKYGLE